MKTTENKEMDLLLRSLGRKASPRSEDATLLQSDGVIGTHLDADELNCYAEGVVSTAERARYTRHLADCDSCRRIVADLVPAAGVTRRYELMDEKGGWSLRDKLAALFAPSVLRFAVPALALTTVIAIAIVALRRQQQTEFVAQNQTPTSPAISGNSESQKVTTDNISQSAASREQQPASADAKEKDLSRSQESDAIAPTVSAPKTSVSADRATSAPVQPGEFGAARSQPTFADELKESDAPPPPPRPGSEDASKMGEVRNAQAEAELQKRRRDDYNSQRREQNEVARPASGKGGPSRNESQNVGGLSSVMSRSSKDEKAAGNVAESRRVSGRLFQRQGKGWIDADYVSGRATVNVSRGSEQFRALAADEPGIRAIAEQLGGEVIVIWKGTAYRIR